MNSRTSFWQLFHHLFGWTNAEWQKSLNLKRFDEISWLVSMVIFFYFTTFLGELMMNDKSLKIWKDFVLELSWFVDRGRYIIADSYRGRRFHWFFCFGFLAQPSLYNFDTFSSNFFWPLWQKYQPLTFDYRFESMPGPLDWL